ncbi:transposase is4 [Holotrichia oblita]|uniref:Transposase is4 n=1 Tax=Holotrichia oblita TaxID=644536 RepID=A0ACB9T231_HOLOL|nr:transposase is4 [Holotrichia oblita]
MEEVLNELDDEQEGALNAVYIPPTVDELTDEEDIDDNVLLNEIPLDGEIAGAFEIDVGSDDALHDESDEEPLSEKRRKLLYEMQYFATGTIRDNRTNKCPLENGKILGKKQRGDYDFAVEESIELSLVRWNDNSVVTVASNVFSVQPLASTK